MNPDESISTSELHDALGAYGANIRIICFRAHLLGDLAVRNEGLSKVVEMQNHQLLELQTKNMALSSQNEELKKHVVQLEGDLITSESKANILEQSMKKCIDPSQAKAISERAALAQKVLQMRGHDSTETERRLAAELAKAGEELREAYKKLNFANEKIAALEREVTQENSEKKCINCHQYFHPKLNTDESCVYHPGKIKYYSCR